VKCEVYFTEKLFKSTLLLTCCGLVVRYLVVWR